MGKGRTIDSAPCLCKMEENDNGREIEFVVGALKEITCGIWF